ncbi:hypothetical protein PRZ48_003380 [Zasmidium cellare]|uniref:Uncharacterized protein n=1 Tax=Zasmidium cellare TaxID=395010 RepID=A0ABR0EV97_ZASCE|nr:hypothetical protein PRZ48_003380 [Zasmidium cellare]
MHTTIFRAALMTAIAPLLTWAQTASSSKFLGNFTEDPNNESGRDLGFIGEVNNVVLATFGDVIQNGYFLAANAGGPCGGDWRFVNRVPTENATNFYAYEYWNGTAYNPTRIGPTEASAIRDTNGDILLQGNQGQIAWNTHLQKYIWLDALPYYDNNVRIRTADQPEGPWTLPSNLFEVTECNNFFYTPTYDNHWYTGDQTFVIHTTCDPNDIQSYEVRPPPNTQPDLKAV